MKVTSISMSKDTPTVTAGQPHLAKQVWHKVIKRNQPNSSFP